MFAFAIRCTPYAVSMLDWPMRFPEVGDGSVGRIRVQGKVPPDERLRVEVPQHQVRVGDGRMLPAPGVADGPWSSPGAARTDLEPAGRIDRCDAAAPGPHFHDVDGGDLNRIAGPLEQAVAGRRAARDFRLRDDRELAVAHERRLGGRPSHVENQQVANAEQRTEPLCADDARGGSRLDDADRIFGGQSGRQDPAVRLHDGERDGHADAPHPRREGGHVRLDDRADVGVDDGRRSPLVLLDLGEELGGSRYGNFGQQVLQLAPRLQLVLRIHVGVDEADGDRLHPLLAQPLGEPVEGRPVDRRQNLARATRTFLDLEAKSALYEGFRFAEAEVVQPRRTKPGELQNITKPPGGDERDLAAPAFDECIGGDRRTVGELRNLRGRDSRVGEQPSHAVFDRAAVVVGRRENLLGVHGAVQPEDDDVGEGPPDVDAQSHPLSPSVRAAPSPVAGSTIPAPGPFAPGHAMGDDVRASRFSCTPVSGLLEREPRFPGPDGITRLSEAQFGQCAAAAASAAGRDSCRRPMTASFTPPGCEPRRAEYWNHG